MFLLICQILAYFSGFESERTVAKFRPLTYSIRRVREIRKFYIALVLRRLRNAQDLLLVFSVTPFKIHQNQNQNHSTDKVQNLGNERR